MFLSHLSLRTRLDCVVALNMQIPLKETTANPVHSKELPLSHLPRSLSRPIPHHHYVPHLSVAEAPGLHSLLVCRRACVLCVSSVNPNNMGKKAGPIGEKKRLAKWQRGERIYSMQTCCQQLEKSLESL